MIPTIYTLGEMKYRRNHLENIAISTLSIQIVPLSEIQFDTIRFNLIGARYSIKFSSISLQSIQVMDGYFQDRKTHHPYFPVRETLQIYQII